MSYTTLLYRAWGIKDRGTNVSVALLDIIKIKFIEPWPMDIGLYFKCNQKCQICWKMFKWKSKFIHVGSVQSNTLLEIVEYNYTTLQK